MATGQLRHQRPDRAATGAPGLPGRTQRRADIVVAAAGAYTNDDPHHLQSTGFVLAPNVPVITAVYSSGAIGGLVDDDVAGLMGYIKSQRGTVLHRVLRRVRKSPGDGFERFARTTDSGQRQRLRTGALRLALTVTTLWSA